MCYMCSGCGKCMQAARPVAPDTCPRCGAKQVEGARKCARCGSPIPTPPGQGKGRPQP